MSRIIKEGNIPKLKVKCVICDCEFEVDYRDLYDRYGGNCKDYVLCPCCNFGTHLSDKAVAVLTHHTNLGVTVELTKDKIQY